MLRVLAIGSASPKEPIVVPDTDDTQIEGDDAGGYAQKGSMESFGRENAAQDPPCSPTESVLRDAVGGAPDLEEEPGLCVIAFFRTSVGTIHFMLSTF